MKLENKEENGSIQSGQVKKENIVKKDSSDKMADKIRKRKTIEKKATADGAPKKRGRPFKVFTPIIIQKRKGSLCSMEKVPRERKPAVNVHSL